MSKNVLFNFTVPDDTDDGYLWRTLQLALHVGWSDATEDLMDTVEDIELIKATTVQGAIEQKYQDPRETLEFWFNWDYMLSADRTPTLMCIGRSGGFGSTRRDMVMCTESNDRRGAEQCFWVLVAESMAEMKEDAKECDTHWSQMWQDWLHWIMSDEQEDNELRYFIREVK